MEATNGNPVVEHGAASAHGVSRERVGGMVVRLQVQRRNAIPWPGEDVAEDGKNEHAILVYIV